MIPYQRLYIATGAWEMPKGQGTVMHTLLVANSITSSKNVIRAVF